MPAGATSVLVDSQTILEQIRAIQVRKTTEIKKKKGKENERTIDLQRGPAGSRETISASSSKIPAQRTDVSAPEILSVATLIRLITTRGLGGNRERKPRLINSVKGAPANGVGDLYH